MRSVADEAGVALPAALGALLVLTIIAALLLSSAVVTNGSANRDFDSKRALGAAEAGLQVARQRLEVLRPPSSQCLTDKPVSPSGGECPALLDQDLGNGLSYSYWVTNTTQAPECGGSASAGERCITAIGMAGGSQRRLQARVKGNIAANPLFPAQGVLAIDGATLGNGFRQGGVDYPLLINGELASDRTISLGNMDVIMGGCRVTSPNGTVRDSTNTNSTSTCQTTSGVTPTFKSSVPSVDTLDFQSSFLANMNETGISWQNPGVGGWQYTAGKKSTNYPTGDTRGLNITSTGAKLILRGGDYNFCDLNFTNGGELLVNAGETVRIFIDSWARTTPTGVRACPGKNIDGKPIQIGNRGSFNPAWSGNPSPGPGQLQIFVYGQPGNTAKNPLTPTTTVSLNNANVVNALLYAPWSDVNISNDMTWNGAITSETFTPNNNMTINWDLSTSGGGGGGAGSYTEKMWRECRRTRTTASDPESGC